MRVILDINDDKVAFIMEVLKGFSSFVRTETVMPLEKNTSLQGAARFKGLLTNEEAYKFHQHIKDARSEWDRDL